MDWADICVIKILYRLLGVKGMGPAKANKLLYSIRDKVEDAVHLEQIITGRLNDKQQAEFMQDYLLYDKHPGITYISIFDERYPNSLKQELGANAPTVLSVMGNLNLFNKKTVGFSGSRKVSDKGIGIASDIASQLSEHDFCLVSGYANGVDMIAHKTALSCGASTIMVLPEGISSFYVRRELKDFWDWNRVLVVSEFEPFAKWMVSRAMQRNRTLIALSKAMLVIEAGEKGGSLDAGIKTIDKGKRLFVPQYAEFPVSALGNAFLLQHGAFPLKMKRTSRRTNLDMLYASIDSKQSMATLFG